MQSYPNGFHLIHLIVEGKYFEFWRDPSLPMWTDTSLPHFLPLNSLYWSGSHLWKGLSTYLTGGHVLSGPCPQHGHTEMTDGSRLFKSSLLCVHARTCSLFTRLTPKLWSSFHHSGWCHLTIYFFECCHHVWYARVFAWLLLPAYLDKVGFLFAFWVQSEYLAANLTASWIKFQHP